MKSSISALVILACGLSAMMSFAQGPPISRWDQIVMLDVQGLTGGRDIWISRTGEVICRVVGPSQTHASGLAETRYRFAMTDAQNEHLLGMFDENRFCTMTVKDRYGLPDEARPIIYLRTDFSECAIGKWQNDRHPEFDPIYKYLLRLVEQGKPGNEIGSGSYDRLWKPDGFPANRTVQKMGTPQ